MLKTIMDVKYLTFECVSKCNMDCDFCFSYWREGVEEVVTNEAKQIIKLLKDNGLEALNFTGGEPLLRNDIVDLIKFSKEIGLSVILTTNGILLKDKIESIADYVDFVGLPLDSSDSIVHNKMRKTKATKDHHALILEMIDIINQKYPQVGIKINTIVTQINKDSILKIGDLINGKVVSWKLSHFIPGAYGGLHEDEFRISKDDFLKVATECKRKYKSINIIDPVAYSQDSGCRILSTNGHLMKPDGNKLEDMGIVLDSMGKSDDGEFNKLVNEHFYNKTYPKK